MKTKRYVLFGTLVLIALVFAFPKPEDWFIGFVITFIGFGLLNLFTFNHKLRFMRALQYVIAAGAVWGIGFGWGTIINDSYSDPAAIISFFGAIFLLVGFSGWSACLIEWYTRKNSSGLTSDVVYSDGMYALVRHPQVLFSMTLLVGFDIFYWSEALAWTSLLWIIGFIFYAALEEKMELVPRFGDEYLTYCDTTPGIFPNISSMNRFIDQYN